MYNDSVSKLSANTLIPKPLMASKIPRYQSFVFLKYLGISFLVFLKYLEFGFLMVTKTELMILSWTGL